MASVVVLREEVVEGRREWRGWIGMFLNQLPVCVGGDPALCLLDVLEWPVTRTSGLH